MNNSLLPISTSDGASKGFVPKKERSWPLLLLALLLCTTARGQSLKTGSNFICWQENTKLTWRDFQAQENPLHEGDPFYEITSANAAPKVSVQGIVTSDGKEDFVVKVLFNKARAWVRDSTESTAALLQHEQLHFDIAELVGRKLRRRIAQARKSGTAIFSEAFGKELKQLLSEENKLDALYDEETAHSIKEEEQRRWENYVKSELLTLSSFKSTILDCK